MDAQLDEQEHRPPPPPRIDSTLVCRGGGDTIAVLDRRRERCQDLLRACINGEYTKTAEFAVEAWHYLSESVDQDQTDPATVAKNLGERASHLLRILSEEGPAITEDKIVEAPLSVQKISFLFLAGAFASDPRLWSAAVAFFVAHLSVAVRCVPMLRRMEWAAAILVGTHAYINIGESLAVCMLHMCAWHVAWLWVISQ
jgi:hypothetical protein